VGKTYKDSPVFKFDKVKQGRKFKKTERREKQKLNSPTSIMWSIPSWE
jgi:hypothetical protein